MPVPDPAIMIAPLSSLVVITILVFLFDDYRTNLEKERRAELVLTNQSLTQEIAHRKEIEIQREQLIQDLKIAQQIAEENSRLKSEFLSTMSHELRTPLNAIEGFTSIMLSNMGIELNPKPRKMVERIGVNSQRLLHLINDFLDLSRIESGRLELVDTPIYLTELIENWRSQVSIPEQKKNLDFIVTVDPTLPSTLYGDDEALSKIALNLLGNAFKFTHEGSIALALKRQDSSWIIEVSDTGIGIPPHARQYIFDEFRQVDSSSKRLYGGAGLGLAIVQKLTRAMGGMITVSSEVNKGSTFTVVLPLRYPQPIA
jgi:signal transduction histidine kinase